ncbi:MAG TPA: DUF366 family protein [Bdellovibrionota bacterium]|nr:DUF366 family protein [Bdellovibrionota bacterium]
MMTTAFVPGERGYTGQELRPHFLLTELGLKGSALGSFIGPCRVATEHLVDWEDRLASDRIEARSMVHFIGEFFGAQLREGVVLQRLLMAIMGETLNERKPSELVLRRGDDLFFKERKLTVSIVTASPVSLLLHTGVNIDPTGAPVPAVGLPELGVTDARAWSESVLKRFAEEHESMEWACAKVRPVV